MLTIGWDSQMQVHSGSGLQRLKATHLAVREPTSFAKEAILIEKQDGDGQEIVYLVPAITV